MAEKKRSQFEVALQLRYLGFILSVVTEKYSSSKNERLIDVLESAPHCTSHPLSATAQTLTMLHGKTTTITLPLNHLRKQYNKDGEQTTMKHANMSSPGKPRIQQNSK
ncbi:hypothetical protein NEUTE1DRAFT_110599 [Neurospora tetrasperma FGSC 2508]|uniref:Uncharacterized protein n=1 Tax=Neurospora tetrasperma (strain FGSC 2508 / ATCC MYA-4615 / P0657) TaxID=510951 RepID=F8MLZ2_NEUT8|nr:uncharacterized protein NEUTE1DRAFT_110599 [Neurospora tetrasperma FGSC 2508]EGO58507.1 hypothetical protein NEUTE1DRAFT_110599 [Neurospora tetrasperma FGSC 2508]EGZ71153.1 hypothetical protein NEUTE2DRAFT_138418 [Neurospora tetrasperma FGSC 2509]